MEAMFVMNPQNSFFSPQGSVYMGEKAEILKVRMADYLSSFNGERVFFREKHAVEDTFFITDKTHSVAITQDYQVCDYLKPHANKFMDNIRYNAFFMTTLDSYLARLKVQSIGIMGVETHAAVLFTSEELRNRGYEVTVIEPCTMSRDDFLHDYAITLMRNALGIRIGQ